MAYDTNNPVGSTDPRDLYDNAGNFDKFVSGDNPFYPDRLGKQRISWSGMEQDFQNSQDGRQAAFDQFLEASAFIWIGDYGAGLTFTSRSQYTVRDGQAYRLASSTTLPYTTTGNWSLEQDKFSLVNSDDILRQDLAASDGATRVGYGSITVGEQLDRLNSTYVMFPSGGDDTVALQAGMDDAKAAGKRFIPVGNFSISSKFVCKGWMDGSGATFNVTGSPPIALEISTGNGANPIDILTLLSSESIVLPDLVNLGKPTTGWAGQGIGVRYVNVQNAKITERLVRNFDIGVQHTAYNMGCAYNTVFGGYLYNNRVNRQITVGNSTGWTNRWDFYGGRYFHNSSEGTETPGVKHVEIPPGAALIINDINFFGASLEGVAEEWHLDISGSYISFFGCRYESATPGGVKVRYRNTGISGEGCYNVINMGRGSDLINVTSVGAAGTVIGNKIYSSRGTSRLSSQGLTFAISNSSSGASHSLAVLDPTMDPTTADPATAYGVALSSQALNGKRIADASDRVRVDAQNGRVYFGDGTAAPTKYIGHFGSGVGCSANFNALTTNTYSLGVVGNTWSTAYLQAAPVVGSDLRLKQQITAVDDLVLDAVEELEVKRYKLNDEVEKLGDHAPWHFGVIAQDIVAAFQARGLNALDYALLVYAEWDAEPEIMDDDGNVVQPGREAGQQYSVRYSELESLQCAVTRRAIRRLEERLSAI